MRDKYISYAKGRRVNILGLGRQYSTTQLCHVAQKEAIDNI